MDGGAWQAIVHGVTKSRTRLRSSTAKRNTEAQGWGDLINKCSSRMDQPPEATQGSCLQEWTRAGLCLRATALAVQMSELQSEPLVTCCLPDQRH